VKKNTPHEMKHLLLVIFLVWIAIYVTRQKRQRP